MENVPQVIANCKILAKLGQGGMGAVFRAVHLTLGRHIALKILPAEFTRNPEYVSRFLREARSIANLNHQNIVLVHDAGEQNGLYYIAMELVDGASLAVLTRYRGTLPEAAALELLLQSAKGLGYAHQRGLVHRDIKPENLLINREGQLKVVDFGLVLEEASQSHLTRTGTFLGTPTFMSPEQCDGEVADARSDLYSLGATFYCVLSGRAPFSATTALGIMYKHKFEAPAPLGGKISPQTTQIILKLLAKKREERYPSAKELAEDITKTLRSLPPEPGWSLDEVMKAIAPPLPEITAADLAVDLDATLTPGTPSPFHGTTQRTSHPSGPRTATGVPTMATMPVGRPPSAVTQPTLMPGTPPPHPPSDPNLAFQPTLVTPGPGLAGATPAPGPLPAMPSGVAAPPAPSRMGLWLGLAAAAVVVIGIAGFLGYGKYREGQLQGYIEEVNRHIKDGDLETAKVRLYMAQISFPNDPRLVELSSSLRNQLAEQETRKTAAVEAGVVRKLGFNELTAKAKLAAAAKNYDEAIRHLEEARKLNFETETVDASIRQYKFEKLQAASLKAEGDGNWSEAYKLAKQALEFGSGEDRVQRLERRIQLEALRAEAQTAFDKKDLLASADKLEQAATFADAKTESALQEKLLTDAKQRRVQHFVQLADAAAGRREWNAVVNALTKALQAAPDDAALKQRRQKAQDSLFQETNYESALALGDKELKDGRFSEAAEAFRTALRHKKDSSEAQQKLAEADARLKLDSARKFIQTKEWRKAQTTLDDATAGLKTANLPQLQAEVQKSADEVKKQLKDIATRLEEAQTAEKNGDLDAAIRAYESLGSLNPTERQTYDDVLTVLKVEYGYRKCLADGDASLAKGAFKEARTSYQLALDKKKDAKSQEQVRAKIQGLDAAEKLKGAEDRAAAKLIVVEGLATDKSWGKAKDELTLLERDLPQNADKQLRDRIAAKHKEVFDTLDRIQTLETAAQAARNKNDFEKTRAAYQELQQLNPAKLADYQKAVADLAAAEKAWQDVAARKVRFDARMTEANQKKDQKDYAGALSSVQKALLEMPNDAGALALSQQLEGLQASAANQALLDQAFQNVGRLVQGNKLPDALAAAKDASARNPKVAELQSMAGALNEISASAQAAAAFEPLIAQGLAALDKAPPGAASLKDGLQRAGAMLAHARNPGDGEAVRLFLARNFPGAQAAARQAVAGAKGELYNALVAASDSCTRLAAKESSSGGSSGGGHAEVGEISLDTPAPKGDPAKAQKYRDAASSLRALAARCQ